MASSIVGFLLIAVIVISTYLLGELLHRILRRKDVKRIRVTNALVELEKGKGTPKFSVRFFEHVLLIHFLWICLGVVVLAMSAQSGLRPNAESMFGVITISIGIWWAWRRGVLR